MPHTQVTEAFSIFFNLCQTTAKDRDISIVTLCPPKFSTTVDSQHVFKITRDQVDMIKTRAISNVAALKSTKGVLGFGKKRKYDNFDMTP